MHALIPTALVVSANPTPIEVSDERDDQPDDRPVDAVSMPVDPPMPSPQYPQPPAAEPEKAAVAPPERRQAQRHPGQFADQPAEAAVAPPEHRQAQGHPGQFADQPADAAVVPPERVLPPPPKPRIGVNVFLFLLTLASCVYWGFLQYQQFYAEDLQGFFTANPLRSPQALLGGLPFGIAAIAFLLAHEMGHYCACRYYKIPATLPYFVPAPPANILPTLLPGTMGAVIRIRGAMTSRRALFDIAVAGPIAGWVTALPILAYGLSQSKVIDSVFIESSGAYLTLGEPRIWPLLSDAFAPEMSASQELVMHPLAFVGWFALLITAMNLLPVGQLDGGHLMYALAPSFHRPTSLAVLAFMLYAGFTYFLGWIVFAAVVLLLNMVGGTRHPRPIHHAQSLGTARIVLTLVAVMIFLTSFMLVPVTLPQIGFR